MPARESPVFYQASANIAVDSATTVVPAEQRWFDLGAALYEARLDKKWSLTDCISFVVMQEMGLTADGDFVQAGFRILMTRE